MSENSTPAFTLEESAALLRAIFPAYPELRDRRAVPDCAVFLLRLRAAADQT